MTNANAQVKQSRAKLSTVFDDPKPEAKLETIPTTTQRSERAGKCSMPFWITIAGKRQLRVMAAEEDTTQQALIMEAINDFFKKRNKPPIA